MQWFQVYVEIPLTCSLGASHPTHNISLAHTKQEFFLAFYFPPTPSTSFSTPFTLLLFVWFLNISFSFLVFPFKAPLKKKMQFFFFFPLHFNGSLCLNNAPHRAPSLLQGLAGQSAACEVSYQATWQNSTLSALCSAIERVTHWPLPSTQKTPNYLICWPALDLQSTQPGTIFKKKKKTRNPISVNSTSKSTSVITKIVSSIHTFSWSLSEFEVPKSRPRTWWLAKMCVCPTSFADLVEIHLDVKMVCCIFSS